MTDLLIGIWLRTNMVELKYHPICGRPEGIEEHGGIIHGMLHRDVYGIKRP